MLNIEPTIVSSSEINGISMTKIFKSDWRFNVSTKMAFDFFFEKVSSLLDKQGPYRKLSKTDIALKPKPC